MHIKTKIKKGFMHLLDIYAIGTIKYSHNQVKL